MLYQGFLYKTDILLALAPWLLIGGITLRFFVRGRMNQPQLKQIDQKGDSSYLRKRLMQMFYAALLPVGNFFQKAHVSPNFLTFASLFLAFLCGWFLAFGFFGWGAFLATLSGLLDVMDGLVARQKGPPSLRGAVLDSSVDRYSDFFMLAGLFYFYQHSVFVLTLVLLAMLGSFMVSYSTAKAEAIHVAPPRGNMKRPERWVYLTMGASLSALSIPYLEYPHLNLEWLGIPMILALGMVGVLSNVSAIKRLATLYGQAEP